MRYAYEVVAMYCVISKIRGVQHGCECGWRIETSSSYLLFSPLLMFDSAFVAYAADNLIVTLHEQCANIAIGSNASSLVVALS